MEITVSSYHIHSTSINVRNVLLSWVGKGSYMLYLKNRNRYRHELSTKMSTMTNFIFNSNTFMGLKINTFWVIKEKPWFWADILDFGGCHLGILRGQRYFWKEWVLKSICTKFHACITKWTILAVFCIYLLHYYDIAMLANYKQCWAYLIVKTEMFCKYW